MIQRLIFGICLTLGASSLAYAQTTQPALSMAVSPDGTIALTLGQKVVADGHWQLMPPFEPVVGPGEMTVGKLASSSVVADKPGHAVVVDSYPTTKATYELTLNGEDLHVAMHIENLNPARTLTHIDFCGLVFHFSRPPDGGIHAWDFTYINANGLSLFHPGFQSPLGVSFAHDDHFAFSVFSASEFDNFCLFSALWQAGGAIPAECNPSFYTVRTIAPGKSIDMDVDFRISTDWSIPHLVQQYKKIYDQHFPTLFYKPDNRPVAQFADVGASHVSRSNPLGFNGAFRRLDSDAGTRAYIRTVAPAMSRAGMLGIIFWSPGGYYPPMYPPDFDQFPESVQQNIPTLVAGFKKYGLRVGLCARCADGVTREPGKEPVLYRLSSDDAGQMKTLADRFHHAMEMGFDLFYLDSIGNSNPNDLEILKKVRATVGPDVPLYTEFCSDMTLPYAGHYCEWQAEGLAGTTPDGYLALRYLCPDSTWLCIDRTQRRRLTDYANAGLVPLIGDTAANRMPASRP